MSIWRNNDVNSYSQRQNRAPSFRRRHFKRIFLNENARISIQISLKIIPKCSIDNKSTMAWRLTGDEPLPESELTQFTDAYMRHYGEMSYCGHD